MDRLLCNYGNCIGIWLYKGMEGKTKLMEKRPVASKLRNMAVGEREDFPISQKRSVENTMYNRLAEERACGIRWSIKTDMQAGIITVTRIS